MRNKDASARQSGYTLAEMMVAVGIFSIFALALLAMWSALATTSLNTISYSQTENDQMRAFDYLKRDIRRATTVAIFNGATPVTGAGNWGSTLQLTLPKYYTDTRQEDDAIGPRAVYTPTLSGSSVTYGAPFTVQYYVSNGAIIRNEAGTLRTVSDGGATYTVSFSLDSTGLYRCRVIYTQTMRSGGGRQLTRQVDVLAGQRTTLF